MTYPSPYRPPTRKPRQLEEIDETLGDLAEQAAQAGARKVPLTPFEAANLGFSAEELEALRRSPIPFTGPSRYTLHQLGAIFDNPVTRQLNAATKTFGAVVSEGITSPSVLEGMPPAGSLQQFAPDSEFVERSNKIRERVHELRAGGLPLHDAYIQATRELTKAPPGVVGTAETLFDIALPVPTPKGVRSLAKGGRALGKAIGEVAQGERGAVGPGLDTLRERLAQLTKEHSDAMRRGELATAEERVAEIKLLQGEVARAEAAMPTLSTPPVQPLSPTPAPPIEPPGPRIPMLGEPEPIPALQAAQPRPTPGPPLEGYPTVGRPAFGVYRGRTYYGIPSTVGKDGVWSERGWTVFEEPEAKTRFSSRPLPLGKVKWLQVADEGGQAIPIPPTPVALGLERDVAKAIREATEEQERLGFQLEAEQVTKGLEFDRLVREKGLVEQRIDTSKFFKRNMNNLIDKSLADVASTKAYEDSLGMIKADMIPHAGLYRSSADALSKLLGASVRALDDGVQSALYYAYSHGMAGVMSNERRWFTLEKVMASAFGKNFWEKSVSEGLESLKNGPSLIKNHEVVLGQEALAAEKPFFGTPHHIINQPQLYDLSHKQRAALQFWDDLFDQDIRRLIALGLDASEIAGHYLRLEFLKDEAGLDYLSKALLRRKPGFLQQRDLVGGSIYKYVRDQAKLGNEVKLNLDTKALAYRRLQVSARVEADMLFLDGVAKQKRLLGGRMVSGGRAGIATAEGLEPLRWRGATWMLHPDLKREAEYVLGARTPGGQLHGLTHFESFDVVDQARGVLLNLDASIVGLRQGWLALTTDPIGAVMAYGRAARTLFTPEGRMVYYTQHYDEMIDAVRNGLNIQSMPFSDLDIHEAGRRLLVEQIPGLRQFQMAQFNYTFPILKHMVYKRNLTWLMDGAADTGTEKLLREVPLLGEFIRNKNIRLSDMDLAKMKKIAADATNNQMGGINWSQVAIGERPALRRLLILTEGWTRAQVGMWVNATKFGPEGVLARRMLIRELAISSMVAGSTSALLGGHFSFDLRSPDFGVIDAPGVGRINMLPRSAIHRMLAQVVAGQPDRPTGGTADPLVQRLESAWRWIVGRQGQLPGVAWELSTGRDYFGREISSKGLYIAQSLLPIVVQNSLEAIERKESQSNLLVGVGVGTLGSQLSPERRADKLAQVAAAQPTKITAGRRAFMERHGLKPDEVPLDFITWDGEWSSLWPSERAEVEQSPLGRAVDASYGQTVAQKFREKRLTLYDQMVRNDSDLAAGKNEFGREYTGAQWRDDYEKAKAQLVQLYRDERRDFTNKTPEAATDKALDGWYDLYQRFVPKAPTGRFDVTGWGDAEEAYLSGLPKYIRAWVEENTRLSLATPTAKEFERDRRMLQAVYFPVLESLDIFNPKDKAVWEEYKTSSALRQREILKNYPHFRMYENAEKAARDALRRQFPEIDKAVVRWGYSEVPIAERYGGGEDQEPSRRHRELRKLRRLHE